ncbi:ABC transporter ATP-binding protein [Qingshengfaniella alkalisoli]|uniref:sn-glycerol-3-phosphate ABC transporter ATP-binding protein UgpC n=1 Tax=Qingshengfaniella alkalisoli TaxID=2599296 RepID=A0A5B8J9Z0_9RHOB|nr:sn-glycerol-3-phosphate ABC transporter ATP-binding protein UgpC [Qingshengfaniella alkalisoli]QDY71040.1 sn-glycerol-3-phosphate ABC transporter ATP-binding protein UgpC [Qingshengfaniella alkalisoli]
MHHVEVRNVSKKFGDLQVMHDIDLGIGDGEFCALLGPSGCGKSTLLRMICGLETVTEGSIHIAGKDVTAVAPDRRGIAMVFQSYALYPHMTVKQNIGFSLKVARLPRDQIEGKTQEIARLLQLEPYLDRKPADLSGGQRQRVAIGRSLVRSPEVFLFDEPLSNLDAKLRVQMRLELARLHKELDTTMIYVTHDQVEAMTLADRIVVLDAGRISQVGTPLELYHEPANTFVAAFIGSPGMNFLEAELTSSDTGGVQAVLSGGSAIDLPEHVAGKLSNMNGMTLGVRPESVRPVAPEAPEALLAGEAELVELLGNSSVVHVATQAGPVILQGDGDLPIRLGDKVGLTFEPRRTHLFDARGQAVR